MPVSRLLGVAVAAAAVSFTASIASAAGILVNPSFELGGSGGGNDNSAIKGWRNTAWTMATSDATSEDGTYVHGMWANATIDTSPSLRPNAVPGQEFSLSFLWGIESGTTLWDDCYVYIDFYDGGGTRVGNKQVVLSRTPTDGVMRPYTTTATAPAGTTSVAVRNHSRNSSGNRVMVDNFVLNRVTPAGAVRYNFGAAGAPTMGASINDATFVAGELTGGAGVTGAVGNSDFSAAITDGGVGRPGVSIASSATPATLAEALLGDDFVQFEIAPTAGNSMSLTGVNFESLLQATAAGSFTGSIELRSSVDNFASALGTVSRTFNAGYANAVTPWYWDSIGLDSTFSELIDPVQFRLYVADSSDTATDAVLMDNITVVGTTAPVPEPVALSAMGMGLALLAIRRRRA